MTNRVIPCLCTEVQNGQTLLQSELVHTNEKKATWRQLDMDEEDSKRQIQAPCA